MRGLAHRIVHARRFEYLIVVLIIGSAALLGIGTSEYLYDRYEVWLGSFLFLTLAVLALEVLLKIFALSPRVYRYFRDGWNTFDFLTISFFLIIIFFIDLPVPVLRYGTFLLLVRLLRLLRGLSTLQEMHIILSTLFRSIPSLAHIAVLLSIIVYVYALVGYWSFGEHDPAHWGDLGVSALSLFQIVTLDGWSEIMHTTSEATSLAWVYFVSFVIISAFVVANVFIAIVVKNLEEDTQVFLRTLKAPASKNEIIQELRSTQQALRRLEERLQRFSD